MLKSLKTLVLAAAMAAALPVSSLAQGAPDLADIARIEVLPGWRMDNGNRMAAIRITLADGWKTYWRSPGDAGIPPSFTFSGSRNLDAITIHWPTPVVFTLGGLTTFGYKDEVVLPVELAPVRADGGDIVLRGEMQLGVCEDICVPISVRLDTRFTGSGAPDASIRASLENRPVAAAAAGIGPVQCRIEPISDGLRITARIDLPRGSDAENAVFELPDRTVWVSQATTKRSGGKLLATADFVPPAAAPFALDRSDVRITLVGKKDAFDIRGCVAG